MCTRSHVSSCCSSRRFTRASLLFTRPFRPRLLLLSLLIPALTLRARAENAPETPPLFERLPPSQTGVDFENRIEADHPMARVYHSGFACGGVAIGDLDGDHRPDLFLVSGPGSNRLFRQEADFQFKDISAQTGIDGGNAWGAGAAMADIDNDGDLDIYVCNHDAPNQLYLNDGDGHFVEAAHSFGIAISDACLMPSFCDFDRDGDLDLFIVTYRHYREGGLPETAGYQVNGRAEVLEEYKKYYTVRTTLRGGKKRHQITTYGRDDYLLRNNGNGTFTNVTSAAGLDGHGVGLAATWWDYNADGWPDLYVCNDFDDPDRFYRNNRDGTFTDVLLETVPHTPWFSMGADAADLNNDGMIDFLAADMSATTHYKEKTTMGAMNPARLASVAGPPPQYMRNSLYLNTGTGRFMEAAYLAGLADSDWSWSVKLADLDNDGLVDVFISNGMTRNFNNSDTPTHSAMLKGRSNWDIYRNTPTMPERNLAFRNEGDLRFTDVSKQWGLDHLGMSFGAALGDLDADGDLDLVVANLDEPVSIFKNRSTADWVTLRLRGKESNSGGIGAVVRLESAGTTRIRHLQPATGILSSNEPLVHFGLGKASSQEHRVVIHWPSGKVQEICDLEVNRSHTIEEEDTGTLPSSTAEQSNASLFTSHEALHEAVHRELPFNDFREQPLLPYRLSRLGPGMAWGDIDNDGDDDLFLSGAAGEPGKLFRNDGPEQFTPVPVPDLENDREHEDMGALFFDADSDGDLDLYVVSGGAEHPAGSTGLQDRLYTNLGAGRLTRAAAAAAALPDTRDSGSVVAAADFDRDGDLDLFLGGRLIPGNYPLTPQSRILRNNFGHFSDASNEVGAQLAKTGLVTSALWSDTDNDGWIDLLVTHEWGPVKLFRNERGRLVDRSLEAGLAERTGWWNGIAGADLDGDEDIDYVVTNFGLNTKYTASTNKPALLYYGDFEGKKRMRLVEVEHENTQLFPVRGRSCSTRAMPFLAGKFQSFRDFALADLSMIYPPRRLEAAHRFAANTLASGVLLNDGNGRFSFRPLPRLAQIAPGFGVVITDADGDLHPDIFLTHNFFSPQPETGRMDGGLGLLLSGRGDGTFDPVWPAESGLIVPVDAKSLTSTDLNRDGWLDVVIGCNDGPVRCFTRVPEGTKPVTVRLQGPPGNPTGVGSRITVRFDNGSTQTAETTAGGGYLSQSSPVLAFGSGKRKPVSIHVRWPDGALSHEEAKSGVSAYSIPKTR